MPSEAPHERRKRSCNEREGKHRAPRDDGRLFYLQRQDVQDLGQETIVATFAGILTHSASTAAGVWFLWLDPLIGGLLLGNLVASISFLPRRMVL